MSARVASDGTVTPLDGRAAPDEVVTEQDAAEPSKVARLLGRILKDVVQLKRRFQPRRIVFQDMAVTGTAMSTQTLRLAHGFGGRVNWWVADWDSGTSAPGVKRNASSTTNDELVLTVASTGTITVIVEEAG